MPNGILGPLLTGSIDYAGLFPPAQLGMAATVRNYAEYRRGADAWALGRLVVPAARLDELERAWAALGPQNPEDDWHLSALVGERATEEIRALGEFNCRHAAPGVPALRADTIEARAESVEAINELLAHAPRWAQIYVEIPLDRDPSPLVAALAGHGARAKARTGGVTAATVPPPEQLLRFIRACTATGVAFKATAGLHHPLRAEYRLTYADDSPRGTMFGFLNVFLAAAFVRAGLSDADALRLLDERAPEALRLGDDWIEWRGHRLDRPAIQEARAEAIVAFGSCSFTEPLDDLRGLNLL